MRIFRYVMEKTRIDKDAKSGGTITAISVPKNKYSVMNTQKKQNRY